MSYHNKLIDIALPLDAINKEAVREKSIRHGHPSTMHIWWARRPLATCRAILFASLVDDPSSHPEEFKNEEAQDKERKRLFQLIEQLVKWENINNQSVLNEAINEIRKYTNNAPPSILDSFCGGGSIPLEAQRLGLKAYASDLNPIPTLLTKALIEIPPIFSGNSPINPRISKSFEKGRSWNAVTGLAEDVRYYGEWIKKEAEKRIGSFYPKAPNGATVIVWIWAKTVKCPNLACGAEMPLTGSFLISDRKNNRAWVRPIVDEKKKTISFEVKTGDGHIPDPTKVSRGAKFRCLVCNQIANEENLRAEFINKRNSQKLMAIVAEGASKRLYFSPTEEHVKCALSAHPMWKPEEEMNQNTSNLVSGRGYGIKYWHELFSQRQLLALTTFSDLITEARTRVLSDAIASGMPNTGRASASAYADAVVTYLAFAVDRSANYWSSFALWGGDFIVQTFGRQAIPMVWDFAEANPFSSSTGSWDNAIDWIAKCLEISVPAKGAGIVKQLDAALPNEWVKNPVICIDPPYYDNICYADLSDFFYVWLRHSVGKIYPDLFSTLLVPKDQELVVAPHRFKGNCKKAQQFFEEGLGKAFLNIRRTHNSDFPFIVYYAFKQTETEESDILDNKDTAVASTGWETMLQGLIKAGFSIAGTWPLRTERDQGLKTGTNVLASSIVLVCHPRPAESPLATRREFIVSLRKEMPKALKILQKSNVAPVDFAQASIGPGMSIFSQFSKILEADGSSMSVRTALQIINQELDVYLTQQEGELDKDTRFCIAWFENYGIQEGLYGEADVLARAKNTSVNGLVEAGVLVSKGGKVRILRRSEYPEGEYDPIADSRLTIWECSQHIIRALNDKGEEGAAKLCAKLGGGTSEAARSLAYRLYSICERKKWAEEALAYNSLVISWPSIQAKVPSMVAKSSFKQELF